MGPKITMLSTGILVLFAFSVPLLACVERVTVGSDTTFLTAKNLIAIAPATASCLGANFPLECVDASQAATAINKAFGAYAISSIGEQAALVAYILFESGNFKYSKNHFPGRPGQGTRMMAMPPIVKLYATSVAGIDDVATAEAAGGDVGLDAILELVNNDDVKSFGSAAWFLSTQCTADVRVGLATGAIDGWHNFLTACVGTTAAAERDISWVAALRIMQENSLTTLE